MRSAFPRCLLAAALGAAARQRPVPSSSSTRASASAAWPPTSGPPGWPTSGMPPTAGWLPCQRQVRGARPVARGHQSERPAQLVRSRRQRHVAPRRVPVLHAPGHRWLERRGPGAVGRRLADRAHVRVHRQRRLRLPRQPTHVDGSEGYAGCSGSFGPQLCLRPRRRRCARGLCRRVVPGRPGRRCWPAPPTQAGNYRLVATRPSPQCAEEPGFGSNGRSVVDLGAPSRCACT